MAMLLIERGANANYCGRNSSLLPLYLAAARGYADVVKLLLAKGAKVTLAGSPNPIQIAEEKGHKDVAELLKQAKPHGAQ